jgi:methylenetetrahydrofolate reductase (NADPH)
MHIADILQTQRPTLSFEFFPPKTADASEALFQTIGELEAFKPSFVSVTYGAGGSTRELTHDLVVRIKTTTTLDPIPHLTCVCHSEADIAAILERYARAGVSNILALGGDPPKNLANYDRTKDAFQHAADLVAFIKKFNATGTHPDKRGFGIGVAGFPEGHPTTPNRVLEMDYLKAKVDAGADYLGSVLKPQKARERSCTHGLDNG